MQHRAVFRDVDFLAAEHGVDPPAQPGLLGKHDQQPERLVIDAIFGIVQKDAGSLGRHPLTARGIIGEHFSQVPAPHRPLVIFEGLPGRVPGGRLRARGLGSCSHVRHLPVSSPSF